MKWILYVTIFTLLVLRTRQSLYTEEGYTLLNPVLSQSETYSNKIPESTDIEIEGDYALNYTGVRTKIPLKDLGIHDKTLDKPFMIHMKFNLVKPILTSIFSIQDDTTTFMSVQFVPIGNNLTNINIEILGAEEISFTVSGILNTAADVLIFVKEDMAEYYDHCELMDEQDVDTGPSIELTDDKFLVLGKPSRSLSLDDFEGLIAKIKIYPRANDNARKEVCPNLEYDPEAPSDDELVPENLKMTESPRTTTTRGDGGNFDYSLFDDTTTNYPMEKGEKGDKGDMGYLGERGFKGEKGEKGLAGIKGEPGESIKGDLGPIGPPGLQGLPGKKGEEGKCECSEGLVSSLLRTMPEMRGPRGDPGPQGVEGPRGLTGQTGIQGPQGDRGPAGLKGETGERGDDGTPGRDGRPGDKGEPGRDGTPGERGPQGEVGPPGPPGPGYAETEEEKKLRMVPGEKGESGVQGPPGPKGERGERGEKGYMGDRGEKGEQGHKGHEGPRGMKGDTGEAGKDGSSGIPGHHGRDGEKGDKGERGDKGSPGLSGLSARLTELLNPDMDPYENELLVEKLRGLKGEMGVTGEKGMKGDRGESGTPGEAGRDGRDGERGHDGPVGPKGDVGPMGSRGHKGDQGEPGPPGLVPASQIALMKGPKGARGPAGPRGSMGPRGYTGKVGAKGPRGDRGSTGPMGPMGLPGINGTIGPKGVKGECAVPLNFSLPKGEKGDRGEPGSPGSIGPEGPPGYCNECNKVPIVGPPGPPGPPGAPGPPGLSISGPKGEPGGIVSPNTVHSFSYETNDIFDDDDIRQVHTVMVRDRKVLFKKSSKTPLGTLAYVIEEDILLIRVKRGWQYIEMGPLLENRGESYTAAPSLTPGPEHRPHSTPTQTLRIPKETRFIRLAALNEPYSGRIRTGTTQGISAADHLCKIQSNDNFRAFLPQNIFDAKNVVNHRYRNLPMKNLQGDILFESWDSMFNGSEAKFVQPNIFSFSHRNVLIEPHWPNKIVWHGSDPYGGRDMRHSCNEWQSDRPDQYGLASPLETGRLLAQEKFSCDSKFIVLCAEISASEPLYSPIPSVKTRHSSKRSNYRGSYNRG